MPIGNNWPETIEIKSVSFSFVTGQRNGDSAVYESADSYLRIGSPDRIKRDLELHKQMETYGFPVAKVVSGGVVQGCEYFIESSLGKKHFGELFADDIETNGSISVGNFEKFLKVVDNFARAQLRAPQLDQKFTEFSSGIHLDVLCQELPSHATKIQKRFDLLKQRTGLLPFVITHGDFNPHNLYPNGVIDLEDSFHAPFGHDIVSALCSIDYFPESREYEYFARYRFSPEHKKLYFDLLDNICSEHDLPNVSELQEEFEFSRSVWLSVRMHEWPELQAYRYKKFIERFLN